MRNALSAAIVTGTVNKTGAIDLFASRAKTALFPSDIVRKPLDFSAKHRGTEEGPEEGPEEAEGKQGLNRRTGVAGGHG